MDVAVLIFAALAVMPPPAAQGTPVIRAGLVIDRNNTLRRGVYRIQSSSIGAPSSRSAAPTSIST